MADPVTDRTGRLTLLPYGVDDHELDILIELMAGHCTGLSSPQSVIDLALWKLAQWYDIPMHADAFDLGRRAQRQEPRIHDDAGANTRTQ